MRSGSGSDKTTPK